MPIRPWLAVISSVLLCAICVRSAVVAADADTSPQVARWFWPGHPDVLRAEIMTGVAQAAGHGRLSAVTQAQVSTLSTHSPLAPEPFAVAGAGALREGRYSAAEKFLLDARKRDPRYAAARFLLVQTYLLEQKDGPGLKELIALTKIMPDATPQIAALLANYAATPGAIPRLRHALEASPDLEAALLAKLAEDPGNAKLILSLASPTHGRVVQWQRRLVSAFLQAGEFRQAFIAWSQFSNAPAHEIGDFSESTDSSPLGWTLVSSSEGAASADGGRLDVRFFGRADLVLASKIVMLAPGRYQLYFQSAAASPNNGAVHLLVNCLPRGGMLVDVAISRSSNGSTLPFEVPQSCSAQQVELKGFAQAYPVDVELSLANLKVRKSQ